MSSLFDLSGCAGVALAELSVLVAKNVDAASCIVEQRECDDGMYASGCFDGDIDFAV
jgi:hypothetical protein